MTISNRLNLFGPAPSDKWGGYNWGEFLWGEGTADLPTRSQKLISETQTVSDSLTLHAAFYISLSDTFTLDGDMGSESLQDGSGYYYVFPDNTTEAENRDIPTWAEGTGSSQSFTCQAAGTSSWS